LAKAAHYPISVNAAHSWSRCRCTIEVRAEQGLANQAPTRSVLKFVLIMAGILAWLLSGTITAFLVAPAFGAHLSLRGMTLKSELVSASVHTRNTSADASAAFEKLWTERLKEYSDVFTLYRHKATGAEILSVESTDDNKVFGVAFRTPAYDSTGAPHIMEHSVLCGSRKYPVKDPFVQLRRSSLQTYLNAMTYPDRTVYPVASQNLKDFYNLANVYIDAVLHPRAVEDPHVLAQEGWHYEIEKQDEDLALKGVVFNEMKGAYSSAEQLLHRVAMRSLFPNTTYRFDSAGDPKEIPSLTFKSFQSFYNKYYHPSNARIYFYGDDPAEKRLQFLESYLHEYGKPEVPVEATRVTTQKMWDRPRRIKTSYPVTAQQAEAEGGAKHIVTMYWLLNEDAMSPTEELAMSIVSFLLLGTSSANLYKVLIESGLGESVTGGGFSSTLKQATFAVGMKGVNSDNVPKVEALINQTLHQVAAEGFSKDAVEAAMNTVEFGVREFSSSSTARGMSFFLTSMQHWMYERHPLTGLRFEAPIQELKAELAKPGQGMLEGLLKKYLIENKHQLVMEGVPDTKMSAREEAAEKDVLKSAKSRMNVKEVAQLINTTVELKKEQATPDSPQDLKKLPSLTLADLERKSKDFNISTSIKHGFTFLTHDVPSNGIVYVQTAFDMSSLPVEDVPLLPLYMSLHFDRGTSKHSSTAFSRIIGSKTGGLSCSKLNALKWGADGTVGNPDDIVFRFVVHGKSTVSQVDDLLSLMYEGITDTNLDSQSRVIEILKSSRAGMESSLRSAGNSYASTRIYAQRSLAGYMDEITGGISYYQKLPELLKLAKDDWPTMLGRLQRMRKLILANDEVVINLSADRPTLKKVDGAIDAFAKKLKTYAGQATDARLLQETGASVGDARKGKPMLRLSAGDEGFVVPTQVNYVVKGGEMYKQGEQISGAMDVVVRFISNSYMWDKVRVMGGAYGGGCSLSFLSGTFSCYSYRDPNLMQTLKTMDAMVTHLEGLQLDDKEIEQLIIGAVGDLDKPMTPASKGWVSMTRFLLGDTLEIRQRRRDEMFSTSTKTFANFVSRMRSSLSTWKSSIFGSKTAFTAANAGLDSEHRMQLKELQ